ncbi:MAG: hypothetical protein LBL18_06130 [Bacteroidales bacterium]|jgi:hypothetical protein|nr:hypothetical protein [Bacteroidales bacterium]
MTITAKHEQIAATAKQIYTLASNCNNFGVFISEQIKGWESTENSCKFTMEGFNTMEITIIEKTPYSAVKFQVCNDKHIPMSLEMGIDEQGDDKRQITVSIKADVPIFLQPIIKKTMQNVVDMIALRIGTMNYELI